MNDNPSNSLSSDVPHFCSPCCRSSLTKKDDELSCDKCGSIYTINDGLYKFIVEESDHGELSNTEMKSVLDVARDKGWKVAIEDLNIDRIDRLIRDPKRQRSIELVENVGGKVLDFGCGYGGVTALLADMFDEVVSLDGSEGRVSFLNIRRQQDNMDNVTTVCHMDVLNLPFPDNHFDAIVLVGVLEYLPMNIADQSVQEAHVMCLKSFMRILRPGGTILVNSKNRFGWHYLLGGKDNFGIPFGPALPIWLADLIVRIQNKGRYRIINYSYGGYRRMFERAGFKNLQLHGPYPGYQSPDYIFDFSNDVATQLKNGLAAKLSRSKYLVFKILALVGLFRRVLPNLTVVGTKP
ncbi:MAG: methyltransferase domain-containing protein [Alphaproteobacteria bacterium]|nr:methyltransferase domain-containing protein [Alphaproteobacteria bacterium]